MTRKIRQPLKNARDVIVFVAKLAWAGVKLVGATLLILIFLAGALGFALYESGYFHGLVKFAIEKYTGRYTRTECRVGRVEGNLFTGMDIYGFVIANGPSLKRDGAALAIDEIHVNYNPILFIQKKAIIDRVYLIRPKLVLKKDLDGRANLGRIFGPKGPPRGKGVYFEVRDVEMDDADFRMGYKSPLSIFTRAHIECTFTKARGAVFIDLRDCSCYMPQYGQEIPHFGSGSLAINARRMHFFGVDVASRTTKITTWGTIRFKPEVYLDLRFEGDPMDMGECAQGVFDDPPAFYGRGRYKGTLKGYTDELVQEGTLYLDEGYLYGYNLVNAFVFYTFDIPRKRINIGGFEGRVNETPTTLNMVLDFSGDKPAYWGEARLLSVNLADFVDNHFLTTDADLLLRFNGTGLSSRDYVIDCNATFGAGRLGPVMADAGNVDFRYARGKADISGLAIRAGGGDLFLKGMGDPQAIDLEITAHRLPFDRLRLGEGKESRTRGYLSFDGHVTGPHNRPSMEGEILLNEFSYGAVSADTIRGEGYWKEYGGDDEANLRLQAWDGKMGPLPFQALVGTLMVQEDVYRLEDGRLEMNAGAKAEFELDYDHRAGRLALTQLNLDLKRSEAYLTAPLVFAREGPYYSLEGGVLKYREGELAFFGTYTPATGGLAMVAEARSIPLDDFIPPDAGVAVTGNINRLRLDLQGTLKDPELYANLAASNLVINGQPLDFVHGEASYEDRRITVPAITAGLGGGTVQVTAYMPLSVFEDTPGAEDLDATLWFSRFPATAFNAFYERGLVDAGYIDGVITGTGTARAPIVRGNLLLSEVARGDLYFAKGRADFTYQDRGVEIRELSLAETSLPNLLVRGRLILPPRAGDETAPPGEMDLSADLIDLDLRLINLFTDEVLVTSGTARGSVQVKGAYDHPAFRGRITLLNGEGMARALRSSFARLSGDIDALGSEVVITRENPITFNLDDGRGTLSGRVAFAGPQISEIDVSIGITNYVIRAISGVQASGDLKAHLTGTPDHLNAIADVVLTGGLITFEFGETGTMAPSKPSPLDYEIRVTAPGNVWLRNRSANIELEADVTVRRTGGRTFYTGELLARRGYYYFLQRDFVVSQADIVLTGTEELDPVVNIVATRRIKAMNPGEGSPDADITITVTGTLREPEITLAYAAVGGGGAVPASQDEILMLLALDLTMEDYYALTPVGIASKESSDILQAYAASELARAVRAGTGLDVFQMKTKGLLAAGEEEKPYAEFTVGQHLTPDLYVSYSGKYTDDPAARTRYTNAAEIDYELVRDFYLVGSTYSDEEEDYLQRYSLGLRFLKKY